MFSGSLVAIVTPMHPDGAIDWPAWERLLAWHLDAGTSGIVVGGTTGESVTLTDADLLALIERARAKLSGRATLLAGALIDMARSPFVGWTVNVADAGAPGSAFALVIAPV